MTITDLIPEKDETPYSGNNQHSTILKNQTKFISPIIESKFIIR